LHETGYIYNDLKTENVMVLNNEDKKGVQVKLIDYGFATRYIDKKGVHLENSEVNSFKGNLLFASINSLEFNMPSRKDDLLSLCYFIIFLLNGACFPLMDFS
jgi:serine/threonine protein kinase